MVLTVITADDRFNVLSSNRRPNMLSFFLFFSIDHNDIITTANVVVLMPP